MASRQKFQHISIKDSVNFDVYDVCLIENKYLWYYKMFNSNDERFIFTAQCAHMLLLDFSHDAINVSVQ